MNVKVSKKTTYLEHVVHVKHAAVAELVVVLMPVIASTVFLVQLLWQTFVVEQLFLDPLNSILKQNVLRNIKQKYIQEQTRHHTKRKK